MARTLNSPETPGALKAMMPATHSFLRSPLGAVVRELMAEARAGREANAIQGFIRKKFVNSLSTRVNLPIFRERNASMEWGVVAVSDDLRRNAA